MMTNALDRVGLFAPAGENLPFFARWQRDDGLFISRAGQYDGTGQALWAIGEHVLRAGDDALARAWLGRMDARSAGSPVPAPQIPMACFRRATRATTSSSPGT